mgnify:CR=1 FL=1|jgi:hypothetical protein|tara:strand:- start:167 stop:463 length:297 start_codon:yes stop_codon:yes gene_type:complete
MKELRKLIREILKEQVVGYTPPSKSSDSGDDEDFMQAGDLSSPSSANPTETDDPEDEEQLQTQRQQMNKQRQKDMNKGDTVSANYDGRIAKKLQKSTG